MGAAFYYTKHAILYLTINFRLMGRLFPLIVMMYNPVASPLVFISQLFTPATRVSFLALMLFPLLPIVLIATDTFLLVLICNFANCPRDTGFGLMAAVITGNVAPVVVDGDIEPTAGAYINLLPAAAGGYNCDAGIIALAVLGLDHNNLETAKPVPWKYSITISYF